MVDLQVNQEENAAVSERSDARRSLDGSSRISPTPVKKLRPEIPLSRPAITQAPTRLYRRQNGAPAVVTIIESIVDVILDSGTSQVGEIQLTGLPTAPTVISVPSLGSVTVPVFPTATSQTASTSSIVPAGSSPSSSMGIQVPGSSSQMVISSPPPTPLPSNPAMSLPTIFSTGSNSTLAATVKPTGNFTTTTFTSAGSGTTLTGTSTLSLPFLVLNTTRSGIIGTALGISASQTSNTLTNSTRTTSSIFHSSSLTTSNTQSSSSTSTLALGPGATGGGAGSPTNTAGSAASSTAAAGAASGTSISPVTSAIVGGTVGGIAGIALILVFLLFLLRWRRRKMLNRQPQIGDPEYAPPSTAQSGSAMAQRAAPLAGVGIAPFMRRLRPNSDATVGTTTTASTERGFQNLGGRKIESVLLSGGDGYGGPRPGDTRSGNLSTTSFYRDSQGVTYGGPGSLPSSMYVGPGSPPASPGILTPGVPSSTYVGPGSTPGTTAAPTSSAPAFFDTRASDKEVAVMRSGPARTPVTSDGFSSYPTPPPRAPGRNPMPPLIFRQDPLGRSHPDGSKGSKFAEDIG
ncbi:hypothetical protein MMC13_003684 [Lambiella insularis]|nr:hypothetical protein [Lambiella insularis]